MEALVNAALITACNGFCSHPHVGFLCYTQHHFGLKTNRCTRTGTQHHTLSNSCCWAHWAHGGSSGITATKHHWATGRTSWVNTTNMYKLDHKPYRIDHKPYCQRVHGLQSARQHSHVEAQPQSYNAEVLQQHDPAHPSCHSHLVERTLARQLGGRYSRLK